MDVRLEFKRGEIAVIRVDGKKILLAKMMIALDLLRRAHNTQQVMDALSVERDNYLVKLRELTQN
jgi:hypothetical protein